MKGFMERTLRTGRRNDMSIGILLLRLGVAYTMIIGHGYPKLVKFDVLTEKFSDPIGIGVTASVVLVIFAEFICSLLIGLGLFTRLASIPLIVAMSVATFIANADKGFSGMESSMLYLIVYVAIFFIGAGRFSIDATMSKR